MTKFVVLTTFLLLILGGIFYYNKDLIREKVIGKTEPAYTTKTREKVISTLLLPNNISNDNPNLSVYDNTKWKIYYPQKWKLYLIKREHYYGNDLIAILYTLQFEDGSSKLILPEILTTGGNPYMQDSTMFDNYAKYNCTKIEDISDSNTDKAFLTICNANLAEYLAYLGGYDKFDPSITSIDSSGKEIIDARLFEKNYLLTPYHLLDGLVNLPRENERSGIIKFGKIDSTDPDFLDQVVKIYKDLF